MQIYVIIATYNASRWLHACLNSLKTSIVPLQVVVVDNNSSDDTVAIIESEYQNVILIKSKDNLGFGKANNVGLNYALEHNADFAFLLNQDAYIQPDTIQALVETSIKNPDYFILSPIHLSGDPTKPDNQFAKSYAAPVNCKQLLSDYLGDANNMKDIYETSFVNAALWLLPKACLLKVGGFDPIFPHYGEDNDYVHRVKYHGYKVGICPHVKATHDRSQVQGTTVITPEKKFHTRFISHLIKLKYLNASDNKLIFNVYKGLLMNTFNNLLHLRFADIIMEFKVVSKVSSYFKEAKEHRELSKHATAPFLTTIKEPVALVN